MTEYDENFSLLAKISVAQNLACQYLSNLSGDFTSPHLCGWV
jgi:hypothetical protein